jgi:hypothetical protein
MAIGLKEIENRIRVACLARNNPGVPGQTLTRDLDHVCRDFRLIDVGGNVITKVLA